MKCYKIPKKVIDKIATRQYKQQYYLLNKQEYTIRNKQASEQKTIDRIEKLSSPEIIYKLEYILKYS
jgi:hypothetical protein